MNVAEYLIKKLEELGINDFFGVPGDYNFNILYAIENNQNTGWIGCTNELNAGYAADGYAREKGFGALVTTYGVGELSAMNAIAGSFAENVPVINIVGTPASKYIADKTLIHHNFQDVKPYLYAETYKNIVATTTFLNRDNAKIEIDRVLKTFVKERKPVYIAIPMDIAKLEISSKNINYDWLSDEDTLDKVVDLISEKIKKSKSPIILGDSLIKRFDAKIEYKEFVSKSGIPTTNFLMGTNLIDSDLKNNLGTYFSKYKNPKVKNLLENTDCLIAVGPIYSDFNSFGQNLPYKINSHIAIYGTYTYIENIRYDNIKMADVLEQLSKRIEFKEYIIEKSEIGYPATTAPKGVLSSKYIYPRLQEFLRENDILIADTGIIPYGLAQIKFPNNSELITQTLWGSIGWATPATLGTCISTTNKRVILFTGEGAHQISAMEIGNMLRYGLKPIIIVLNNKGYTIERLLSNSPNDSFNEIMQMNYSKFARVFEGDLWSTQVKTEDDFDKALKVTQIMNKLCYIEIITDSDDIPELIEEIITDSKNKTENNSITMTEKYFGEKLTPKITDGIKSFATKVHESLKG